MDNQYIQSIDFEINTTEIIGHFEPFYLSLVMKIVPKALSILQHKRLATDLVNITKITNEFLDQFNVPNLGHAEMVSILFFLQKVDHSITLIEHQEPLTWFFSETDFS
jgi:hypothetical protein